MWDMIIVMAIILVAAAYAVYKVFLRPSCGCGGSSEQGCGCGSKKTPAGMRPLDVKQGCCGGSGCGCGK